MSDLRGYCKDCRCWYYETEEVEQTCYEHPDKPPTLTKSIALKKSQCRRYPPMGDFEANGGWVHTEPNEWCEEFRS